MEMSCSDLKMYNITEESVFIEISNVPSLNLLQELTSYINSHAHLIEQIPNRLQEHQIDSKQCIQSFLAQFPTIHEARKCKKAIHKQPFYGQSLYLTYRPDLETWSQPLSKLSHRQLKVSSYPKPSIPPSQTTQEIRARISLPEETPAKRKRI